MLCPYRKLNDKETQREYKPFPEGSKIRTTEHEYFPQCQGDICPLFEPELKSGCWRVQKEINEAYAFGKENDG